MERFPPQIIEGMQHTRAMTTCAPVQFDNGQWETAVFFEVGGETCEDDRRALRDTDKPFPVQLEADLIEHDSAGVVALRFEVLTNPHSPMVGEVLITPGLGNIHFETLDNLSRQSGLRWYFGDADYRVIHAWQTPLGDEHRAGYRDLLADAVAHDALLRLTGRYDAGAAMTEVVSRYQYRDGVS